MRDDLISPSVVALRLGFSLPTIKKMARQGKLPGAVFLPCGNGGRQHIMFDSEKLEAFIEAGGELPRPEPRFQIHRFGGRNHSGRGGRRKSSGGVTELRIASELTVTREKPEGALEPGQGPTGYELRCLGAGRNVTDEYPWSATSLTSQPL